MPPLPPSPPPVVKVLPRPPCNLPALPQPVKLVPHPGPDGESLVLTRDDMTAIVDFELAEQAWIAAASACLEVKP